MTYSLAQMLCLPDCSKTTISPDRHCQDSAAQPAVYVCSWAGGNKTFVQSVLQVVHHASYTLALLTNDGLCSLCGGKYCDSLRIFVQAGGLHATAYSSWAPTSAFC